MDGRNIALAVFLLFAFVAHVAHASRMRFLVAAPQQNLPTSAQVSGENIPDPNQNSAVKKPESDQLSHNSSPLDSKRDLVSPLPQSHTTDNSKNINFPSPGRSPVQNQIVNNEETTKGISNKENGKTLSPPDKGKNVEHENGTDLLSHNDNDKGNNPDNANDTVFFSPSAVKKNVNDKDLLTPPVSGTDGGKNDRVKEKTFNDKSNEMGDGKNGEVKEKTVDDKNNEIGNGKNGGVKEKPFDDKSNEMDNEKNGGVKEKTTDNKSNETDNEKNGGAKEKTIDDKSNETDNEKNGGTKEKIIDEKSNEIDNGKNSRVKEKTVDDKSAELDNGKSNRVKEKTVDGSNGTDNGKNGGAKEKTIDDKTNEKENGKNGGATEKTIDDKMNSELSVNETCGELHKCKDLDKLIACIQSFDLGSRKLTVLVQNDGERTLMVNLIIPTAIENPLKPLKVSKHQTQKINILLSSSKNTKLILNAGNGECVLHTNGHEPEDNFFIYLPSYDKLLTPVNGAYFLILSVLIFGGTWACCKCKRRRWNDGVPYQELEMGLPESVSVTNVETAEGWDEGWDDDWDENNAVKSPGASRIGNISANGLTSRSPNRDGWENDWDV